MIENFKASLDQVLKSEGGYVNDPRDSGGVTNLGCTQRVYEFHMRRPVSDAEMRCLTPADVGPIYKTNYWDKIKGDQLPAGLDYAVFDCAINSGPSQAAKFLQQVLEVTEDGAIGPGTLAAVSAHKVEDLIAAYQFKRLSFMQRLKTWNAFGKGWSNRVAEVATLATEMATA
jgi:lysozyme family protein